MLICLWSGPRNVSTALMYSFAQRTDTQVVDEPLYGHYLTVSGADHPAAYEVMDAMNCDGDAVMRDLLAKPQAAPIGFAKHMAHHLVALDEAFLAHTTNVLLIRNPQDMLPSLTIQLPHANQKDTGLGRQLALLQQLQRLGQTPPVLDAKLLLDNPQGVLTILCERLGIAFDPAMLSWAPGARPEDGVWAPHWYQNVHRSTGFGSYTEKGPISSHLRPLLDECRPYYEQLFEHAIRG
ncbi:MAG: sulfotransferase family protein [Pseudomonadota bacterium]